MNEKRKSSEDSLRGEIATIGENLGVALLTKLEWGKIERHPFDPGLEWYRHGTDIAARNPTTNELYIFELRWWQSSKSAEKRTTDEVMGRRIDEGSHPLTGEEIRGAYIAIVDLDKGSKTGELRIKRVW